MSLTSAEHNAELQRIGDLLAKEAYQIEMVPASDLVPYDRLLLRLESFEEKNRVWRLELSYLPALEKELDNVSILQCFVALLDGSADEHRHSLSQLIVKVNVKLPIGCFGFLDNPGTLFFKHNAMLPNDNNPGNYQVIRELVPMTAYLITTFSESLIQVATGQRTIEEAMADMPFSNVFG